MEWKLTGEDVIRNLNVAKKKIESNKRFCSEKNMQLSISIEQQMY
jgi:hypothetical protein